jgi:hypothetical protein
MASAGDTDVTGKPLYSLPIYWNSVRFCACIRALVSRLGFAPWTELKP